SCITALAKKISIPSRWSATCWMMPATVFLSGKMQMNLKSCRIMANNEVIYRADKIFTGRSWLVDQAVVVSGNKVTDLIAGEDAPVDATHCHIIAPAFIDIQI